MTETVSKTVVGVSPPWVRIPPSPPEFRITIAFFELEVAGIPSRKPG